MTSPLSLPENRPEDIPVARLRQQVIEASVLLVDTIDKQQLKTQILTYAALLRELRRLSPKAAR